MFQKQPGCGHGAPSRVTANAITRRRSKESTPKPISGEVIAFDRSLDDIVISRDGRTFAAAMQDGSMRLLPVDGGERRLVQGGQGLTPVALCGDGSLLAYRSGEMPVKIMRVDRLQAVRASGRREIVVIHFIAE